MLEVLDTAGQEEYRALRDQWIRDGEAFLLVYSVSSRFSFIRILKFHAQVSRVKESSGPDNHYSLPGPPICLLIGNKSDSENREVSTIEGHGHNLANELGCYFVELSAKSHQDTEKAFYDLVRHVRRRRIEASRPLLEGRLRAEETITRTGYTVKRRWWRKRVSVPPGDAKSEDGQKRLIRALVSAAKHNHEKELVAYLEAGASPNGQPGSDGAAIHAAAASGHANIINVILKKGAAINARGPSGTSALQIAAAEGRLAVVKLLLHKGAQINQTSQLHGTALSAAASRGRVEVVRFLLQKDANVNVVGGPYGNALQAAAWIGSSTIVEALLGAGADINARGDGDCTALQIAAVAGHANVIRSLLNLGGTFNINAPGGEYGPALKAADDRGHFEAVTVLLKEGAAVTPKSPAEPAASDSPDRGEAEVAPMTGQIVEDVLATPRSPAEAAGSGSPETGEAEEAPLHD
jgi:ankyrin repeat protein